MRNKKETRYCYSEAERDAALEETHGPEVDPLQGPRRDQPEGVRQFIGEGMRLVQVTVHRHMGEVSKCLDFFMGKNTPKRRKDFIVDLTSAALDLRSPTW